MHRVEAPRSFLRPTCSPKPTFSIQNSEVAPKEEDQTRRDEEVNKKRVGNGQEWGRNASGRAGATPVLDPGALLKRSGALLGASTEHPEEYTDRRNCKNT